MKTLLLLFVITFNLSCYSYGQKQAECIRVRKGMFYIYPGGGKEHYRVVRNDTLQTEINLKAGTTSYWRITWLSDCTYKAKYLSGGKIESEAQKDFYKRSVSQFTISKVAKDYYLYTGTIRSPTGKEYSYSDTAWLHGK